MRQVSILFGVMTCVALAAPASAQTQPRYSAGNPPGLRTDSQTGSAPDPAVPPRYSVQASGPAAAPATPVQTAPAPALRGEGPVVASHPIYSAGDPPPPAPAPVLRAAVADPIETVTVRGYRGYILGPSDKVHVTVYGETDLTGDFEISNAGRIAFPLIGEVTASGLTATQLGDRLAAKLGAGYLLNPRVAVEVALYRPFYVTGQVMKPGSFPYAGGMTVTRAITLAGGFTPQAIEDEVYIRHEGETQEREYDIDAVPELEPGDVVRVRQSTFWSVVNAMVPLATIVGVIRSGVP